MTCKDEVISSLYDCMASLDERLGSDCGDEAVEGVRRELWMTLLCAIRSIVPYSKLSHLPKRDDDESWEDTINRRKGYLSSDVRDLFLHVGYERFEEAVPNARGAYSAMQ